MKRIVNIVLCALMAFSLTACEGLEALLGGSFSDILEGIGGSGDNDDEEENGENVYPEATPSMRFEGAEYIPCSYWTVFGVTKNKSYSAHLIKESYNPDEFVVVHFGFGDRIALYKGMERDGELRLYYDGEYGNWTLDEDNRTMTITCDESAPKLYEIGWLSCNDIGNGEMNLRITEIVSEPDREETYTLTTQYHLIGRNSEVFTFMGGSFPGGSGE